MRFKVWFIIAIALSLSQSAIAQKSVKDYLDELKNAGFPEVVGYSFAITKNLFAMTMLYRNVDRKVGTAYFAEAYPTKDGSKMLFKALVPCELTNSKNLVNWIIMINDQKVEAYYGCSTEPGGSETKEIYLIKSDAGNNYAKRQFLENSYVVVALNGFPIPFHTEGFSKVIAAVTGQAL